LKFEAYYTKFSNT